MAGGTLARLFALLALLGMSGCTRYSATPLAVYGPFVGRSSDELMRMAAGALAARGYRVESTDPERGRLTVESRTRMPHGTTTFRVQVFREGWIQLVPEGEYVRVGDPGVVSMPTGLTEEYVALASELLPLPGGAR